MWSGAVIIMIAMVVHGCRKEEIAQVPMPLSATMLFGSNVVLDVGGRVVDEQGVAVEGASVTAGFGAQTTLTDANGVFRLIGITAYSEHGYVKVSKSGYFNGSRSFVPVPGINNVRVTLLADIPVGTIQASAGGTVTGEGVEITLPAGTYVRNGAPYSGPISVTLNHIDPSSGSMYEQMPGALLGVADGSTRLLRSFGMVAVELSDAGGAEVEIAEGAMATVAFPVPASLLGEAPATIDLWHFDEVSGVWLQEGQAHLQGGSYVAEVGHFSWWNCDVPNTFVRLDGQVKYASTSAPISGARVVVLSQNAGTGTTYTNGQGYYGGIVPDAQSLIVSVLIPCGQGTYEQVHQQTFAGLVQDHVLNVLVPSEDVTIVHGMLVDCENDPVIAGYVMAGPVIHFCSGGEFNFGTCLDVLELVGVDQGNFASTEPQTLLLSGGVVDVGNVQVCADPVFGGVTDIEGYTYETVILGSQEWMAENLRTVHYANGDPIPIVHDHAAWVTLSTGTATWINTWDDEFGKLYNWYAVTDPRNVCPVGWHVPSDPEWKQLELALGMSLAELDETGARGETANVGGKMKVVDAWSGSNAGATNESGFSALPGGGRTVNGGPAVTLHSTAFFWSASEMSANAAWSRFLVSYYTHIRRPDEDSDASDKRNGLSVRCVRD